MPFVDEVWYQIEKRDPKYPWLLLMHPLMGSGDSWRNLGYTRRFSKYNILTIDALGHGKSEKAENYNEYMMNRVAPRYLQVLDELGLQQVYAVGYSLGGWNLLGMARERPELFRRLAIGGAHPLKRDPLDLNARIQLYNRPISDILEHYKISSQFRKDQIKKTNFPSLVQTLKAMSKFQGFNTNDYQKLNQPLMIYVGAKDYLFSKIKESINYYLNAELTIFFELDHNQPMLKVNKTYPILESFFKSNNIIGYSS